MTVWDRGGDETEEWTEGKVRLVLHGSRVDGRYVLQVQLVECVPPERTPGPEQARG